MIVVLSERLSATSAANQALRKSSAGRALAK